MIKKNKKIRGANVGIGFDEEQKRLVVFLVPTHSRNATMTEI